MCVLRETTLWNIMFTKSLYTVCISVCACDYVCV